MLTTYYGREFSEEEKQSLYASIKLIPLSSRVSRRVLESLWLIHQVQVVTNERRVVNLLKKIEEKCGIELPIKIEDLPATDSE